MEMLYFNVDHGYLEGIARGYKESIITSTQYMNFTQCDSIEDLKLQLTATDYLEYIQNESSPISTITIHNKLTKKLVDEFKYLRINSTQPLSRFLDYISYAYMIDNVVLLITGTLHQRDTRELLERCHPLGLFDGLAALCVATTVAELYNSVLIETPLAPYFKDCLSAHDLDEMNIEIIRNTLYKAYLEDFKRFCDSIGGPTASLMSEIIGFEADRRAITITLNSFGTELQKDERSKLYANCGKLYPEGHLKLSKVDDVEGAVAVIDQYPEYRAFFDTGFPSSSGGANQVQLGLEDKFFDYEVKLLTNVFLEQYNFAVFYSLIKLKEQEIRNVVWISECIAQKQKDKINNYIPIF